MGLEGALGRRVTVGLLLALWYCSSAVTSISTKEILRSFPFPVTIAAVQQLLSAALGRLGIASWQTASGASPLFDAQIAPVVTAMVISLVAYRWSLMHASVSFTCIVKTLAPLFTILFSFAVEGQPTTAARCASVVPVVLGVALTSATEVEFSSVGALAALIATASQALQMVLAKRLLSRGVWSKPELFYRIALSGFCLLLGLSLLVEAQPIRDELRAAAALSDGASRRGVWRPAGWLLVNGICYFVNQYAGLSVLDTMDTPLSHALANVLKRAVVVVIAMLHAGTGATPAARRSAGQPLPALGRPGPCLCLGDPSPRLRRRALHLWRPRVSAGCQPGRAVGRGISPLERVCSRGAERGGRCLGGSAGGGGAARGGAPERRAAPSRWRRGWRVRRRLFPLSFRSKPTLTLASDSRARGIPSGTDCENSQ